MHRPLALFLATLFIHISAFAQSEKSIAPIKPIEKPSRDFLMIQLTYDGWQNVPDSIKLSGFHRGINAYVCYDFPLAKTNFSFAAGVGVGTSSMYLKNQRMVFSDTGAAGNQVSFVGEEPLKDYTKFKFTTAYIEAPFELRYFANKENRNKGFKAAIGLKAGTLLAGHTKGVYKVKNAGNKITDKEIAKRYLEPWRVSATLRLGYGNVSFYGAYQLNGLFKDNQGPAVTPYSVGIAITGL